MPSNWLGPARPWRYVLAILAITLASLPFVPGSEGWTLLAGGLVALTLVWGPIPGLLISGSILIEALASPSSRADGPGHPSSRSSGS